MSQEKYVKSAISHGGGRTEYIVGGLSVSGNEERNRTSDGIKKRTIKVVIVKRIDLVETKKPLNNSGFFSGALMLPGFILRQVFSPMVGS